MSIQILKNTTAVIQETFSAGAADGTVTITILRADGSTLIAGATTSHVSGGIYTYQLTPQTELDLFTASWTGSWSGVQQTITSYVEVVGDVLFPIAAARTFGDKALADQTKYPDEDIRATRERITDLFEQVCHVSFIPRYARDTLDGTNSDTLELAHRRPRRIIAASVDGTSIASQLANIVLYPSGRAVWKPFGWWPWKRQNITVAYEHGYPTPPTDIVRAALTLCRYDMVANDITDRMIAFANDLGSVRLSVPGTDYPTGIPVVDSTLARYDECPLLLA